MASVTVRELQEILAHIRSQRDKIIREGFLFSIPHHCSIQREEEILQRLQELESSPPTGPAMAMLLVDALNLYEQRLKQSDDSIKNSVKKLGQLVDDLNASVSRGKLLRFIVVGMLFLQLIVLGSLFLL